MLQVVFPLVLDVHEFCTPELKKQLEGPRLAGKNGDGWLKTSTFT